MLKSASALGAATLLSRILGMIREMVYSRFMGDHPVAGTFYLAFMIPNLFRRLLGEGALTAAFVPLFKSKEKTEGDMAMWQCANAVISALAVVSVIVVAIVMLAISGLLLWGGVREDRRMLLELLRLMFPYMPLVCLAATFMAMLNARGQFFLPAMGATMLNLVMIASVVWLAPAIGDELEEQVFGLGIGVLIAGVAQAGFQLPALCREGFRLRWVRPWDNPEVREVARKMVPGTIGVAAFQLNVVLTQGMAYYVDEQIVASFNYAVRLMELPQGVFGISLATFLLPTLAGLAAEKNYGGFRDSLRQGISHLVMVNLVMSVLLLVLAEPIIRLLFEGGEFGSDATRRAGFALACLAPGLVLFSTVNVLARAFYALGDTRTPMLISSFCLGMNVVFTLWLVPTARQGGLGIANTLSSGFNVFLLGYALRRKLPLIEFGFLWRDLIGLIGAATIAAGATGIALVLWERSVGHAALVGRCGAVFVPAGLGLLVYAGIVYWLGNESLREMIRLLRSRLRV